MAVCMLQHCLLFASSTHHIDLAGPSSAFGGRCCLQIMITDTLYKLVPQRATCEEPAQDPMGINLLPNTSRKDTVRSDNIQTDICDLSLVV
jgi:hypothetical protein